MQCAVSWSIHEAGVGQATLDTDLDLTCFLVHKDESRVDWNAPHRAGSIFATLFQTQNDPC
jgi:hypothetical protein